jgi:hypothetical protein
VSGELLPARPRVGDEITLRIDCRQREVAARSSANPDTWHVIPVRLPDDVHTVMPWCLSEFPGETFTLVSIAAGEATLWAPRSHAFFPPCARRVAVTLAQLGYHLAARKLPVQSQGLFVDIWLSNVMPFVLDEAGMETLVMGETVARLASHAHRTPPADLGAVFTNPAELPLALRLLWESGSEWHQLAVGHYNVFGFNLRIVCARSRKTSAPRASFPPGVFLPVDLLTAAVKHKHSPDPQARGPLYLYLLTPAPTW